MAWGIRRPDDLLWLGAGEERGGVPGPATCQVLHVRFGEGAAQQGAGELVANRGHDYALAEGDVQVRYHTGATPATVNVLGGVDAGLLRRLSRGAAGNPAEGFGAQVAQVQGAAE